MDLQANNALTTQAAGVQAWAALATADSKDATTAPSTGLGRNILPELAIDTLDHFPRSALHKVRLVNRAWSTMADRALAPHATLGLPKARSPGDTIPPWNHFPPVRPAQLDTLRTYGGMTRCLDVLPHTDCAALDLPNLEMLRIFPAKFGSYGTLCGHCRLPCTSLAALRPKTLVVVGSAQLGSVLGIISDLLPPSTLESVAKLIVVLPGALGEPSLPDTPILPAWAQDITLVLASAEGRCLRPPVRPVRYLHMSSDYEEGDDEYCTPPARFAVVGASESAQKEYQEEYPGTGVNFISLVEYSKENKEFSAAETAALLDPTSYRFEGLLPPPNSPL